MPLRCATSFGFASIITPLGFLAIILSLTASPSRAEQTSEARYLDGLISRQLFLLAESYCGRQLRRDDLPARQRTELAVDLARVRAEAALNAPAEEREQAWQAAHAILEQQKMMVREPTLRLLLDRQDALVHVAQGRQARQEAAVVADSEPLLEQAKTSLRKAVQALDDLSRDIDKLIVEREGKPSSDNSLDAEELRRLARDLKYRQAEALRNQGLAYPTGDRDRRNALASAAEQFHPLAERPSPIDWESRLGLVRSLRDSERFDEAAALLAQYQEQIKDIEIAVEIAMNLRLEQARLAIDRKQHDAALAILDPGPPSGAEQTAAWDYALLVVLLNRWQATEGSTDASKWQAEATDQVRLIEARHSPYWRRRAELLLGSIVATSPTTDNLEVLVRAAQAYYRGGKIDDAIAAYQRAYEQAVKAKLEPRAFEIGFTLASIDHQRRHHQGASDKYRQLALAHAGHTRATEAHLLAIFNAAQLLRGAATPDAQAYETLLREHLGRWPRAASADQARLWLGRLMQQQRKWSDAAETFAAVRPESKLAPEAFRRGGDSYRAWLGEKSTSRQAAREIGAKAADFFESIVLGAENTWPEKFTPLQRQAALDSARFRIEHAESDYRRAELLLRAALSRSPEADSPWKASAGSWLVLSLARQPNQLAAAEQVLQELAGARAAEMLTLLEGLNESAQDAPPTVAQRLGQLQIQVVSRLSAAEQKLTASERARVARIKAEALKLTGDDKAALAAYAQIVEQFPNDGDVQAAYAELLLASDQAKDWRLALDRWRTIERRSKPGSPRWYQAKLSQASAHEKLGNCQQAIRIVQFTRVLHKNLGGPTTRGQFEALLKRCE